MTTFAQLPLRPRARQDIRAAFDRRLDAGSRHFRRLSSTAAALFGLDRSERERPSPFEIAAPERR